MRFDFTKNKKKIQKHITYHLRNTHIQKISIYIKNKHKSRTQELTQVRARESLGIPYWKRGAPSGLGRIIYLDRLALKKQKKSLSTVKLVENLN